MFVLKGDKRINLNKVREYRPIEKILLKDKHFMVEFIYDDGAREEFNFFDDERWRNQMIITLDKMFLKKDINEKPLDIT